MHADIRIKRNSKKSANPREVNQAKDFISYNTVFLDWENLPRVQANLLAWGGQQ